MSSRQWRTHSNLILDVARGAAGIPVIVMGRNPDVDTSPEDLCDQGGDLTFPTSAESLEVLSASANDDGDPAGTGARTVTVAGLDANYVPQSLAVTMNGTTAVALTGTTWRRTFSVKVATAGSGGVNAGNITLRVAGGGATRAFMLASHGRTNLGFYTVPAGKAGYLLAFNAWFPLDQPTSPIGEIGIMTRSFNAAPAWHRRESVVLNAIAGFNQRYEFPIPLRIPEKSDIKLRAFDNNVADTLVAGGLHMLVMEE